MVLTLSTKHSKHLYLYIDYQGSKCIGQDALALDHYWKIKYDVLHLFCIQFCRSDNITYFTYS